ncbi:MAG: hypothetical protein ACOY4R_30100 [Pseudomonadota bacterium]
MLGLVEIAHGVRGALAFLRRDPSAPMAFDDTMEGCLRSFRVMAVAAPFYALYAALKYANVPVVLDATEVVLVEGLRYVVDWLLFPVIFYEVAGRRGWLGRYPRYISALNWVNLPAIMIALVSTLVQTVAPLGLAVVLDLAVQVLFFYWFLMVTRLTLGIDWLLSMALLALSWVPSFFLSFIVARYLGVLAVTGA